MGWATRARWFFILALVFFSFGNGHASHAAPAAPTPRAPAAGERIAGLGATLQWELPLGSTQYQLQVIPANGDGPGVNLIRSAENSFTILAPPTWYILLPDMTYTWRVRASDSANSVSEDDASWGPWSPMTTFRTAGTSSAGMQPVHPLNGAQLQSAEPVVLQWSHPDPAIFYYEVQVSRDQNFNVDPSTASSFVWWLLRHGAATTPANSWTVPVLEADSTYFWRVRPRVQGDGAPVGWGPTWSFRTPPLPRMAFSSERDGNPEIYLMHADGTLPTRLTAHPARDRQPSLSPDGRRIAFVSDRDGNDEIYVMNNDGSGLMRLTSTIARDTSPSWSPDGSALVFVSDRDGNPDIYRIVADGTGLMRLTTNPGPDGSPAWAPDGGSIAFVSERDGRRQIYLMRSDGGGQVNRSNTMTNDFDPAWSPADGRIAFASDREGNNEIYAMTPEGTGLMRLTHHPSSDTNPKWAPDGSSLAFVSDRDGNNEIFLMQWNGDGAVNRTVSPASDGDPSWPSR